MSDFKPAREPIFNFSEKAPVMLAGALVLAYAIDSFAPGSLQTVFREWGLLAAVDGSVDIDRDICVLRHCRRLGAMGLLDGFVRYRLGRRRVRRRIGIICGNGMGERWSAEAFTIWFGLGRS